MSTQISLPQFENVRLAAEEDLPRIASVAMASFFHSPTFQFQRPFHTDYPEDTFSSYWNEYLAMINDPAVVVLVAEDDFNSIENQPRLQSLQQATLRRPTATPQGKVIVGVCSIILKPGSSLIGQLKNGHAGACVDSPGKHAPASTLGRDLCSIAIKQYEEMTAPAKSRHLAGRMRLSSLAVHPAYWRRGHGNRLVTWCTRLADIENAVLGVSATPLGTAVAAQAGFEEKEVLRFTRTDASAAKRPCEAELWIGVRPPLCSPSDTSTACSNSPVPDLPSL